MEAGALRDVLTAALGIATGVLSGAFGVGGAIISQPGIRALGVAPLIAVGTTLPSIFPSAVSGALRYRSAALISWTAVRYTVPAGFIAAIAGALLSDVVPGDGHLLMLMTAGLLAFTAWRMYHGARAGPRADGADVGTTRGDPRIAYGAVGLVAGLLSGLLGIGGGVIMVPGFTGLAGLSVKAAIATSLVCVGAFAVPGTVTHALQDQIDWRVALVLTIAVIPGARLGAGLTLRATDRRLRYSVASFLGVIAVVYAVAETIALAN